MNETDRLKQFIIDIRHDERLHILNELERCREGYRTDQVAERCAIIDCILYIENGKDLVSSKYRWNCKANNTADPPEECDWPFCDCDPFATKIIEAIDESGLSIIREPR
ncbi:MAG: hypothetical protein PHX80_04105 [Candidatus Nanoarchaeia archaeon]|nr:hypothetical protein [Candidatus Nanoarchaeia archaeon]